MRVKQDLVQQHLLNAVERPEGCGRKLEVCEWGQSGVFPGKIVHLDLFRCSLADGVGGHDAQQFQLGC